MKQKSKYKKLPNGEMVRVVVSFADDYTDWFAYIRLKTNLEKKEVAHELVDLLGEDIYSDVLNEVINYLEVLYSRKKKQVKKLDRWEEYKEGEVIEEIKVVKGCYKPTIILSDRDYEEVDDE